MTLPSPTSTARTRQIVQQIASQCEVAPDQIEDAYPCTPFQADLFRASTQGASIEHYNLVFSLDEPTSSAIDRLTNAFSNVHDRNPILRSRIVQYTEPGATTPHVVQAIVRGDLRWHEFDDLAHYCRLRIGHCLRYGEKLVECGISRDRKHLVWTLHHALYDGWSMGMLWKDICNLAEGKKPVFEQRPKYVKFIAHLQDPATEADRAYWTRHLAGYSGPRFELHRLPPETIARRGGSLKLVQAREGKIGMTARIQAAWFCTLVELYRSLDVMTLNAATGRHCPVEGVADMIGPCLCLAPFRQRVDLKTPLYQFVLDVENASGEMFAHELSGMQFLENLIEEAKRPNHTFNLKSGLGEDFAGLQGASFQPAQVLKKKWDWDMGISVGVETLRWDMIFDPDRLDQDAVALICQRFPLLLQTCQTVESQSSVTLESVVDVTRL